LAFPALHRRDRWHDGLDRSWYGRLLVERVEGLIDKETAKRSGQEIVEFERLLVDNDVTLVKFWLHLSTSSN